MCASRHARGSGVVFETVPGLVVGDHITKHEVDRHHIVVLLRDKAELDTVTDEGEGFDLDGFEGEGPESTKPLLPDSVDVVCTGIARRSPRLRGGLFHLDLVESAVGSPQEQCDERAEASWGDREQLPCQKETAPITRRPGERYVVIVGPDPDSRGDRRLGIRHSRASTSVKASS